MAYPPPPYADALTGGFVAGEAICGTWFAYPPQSGLLLGGYPPAVTALEDSQVPPAGLLLAAAPPDFVGQGEQVPLAGLVLGGALPTLAIESTTIVTVGQAGLLLGAVDPTYQLSQAPQPDPAGLLLGAFRVVHVGIRFVTPVECIEIELEPDSERVLVLAGAPSSDQPLDPVECL